MLAVPALHLFYVRYVPLVGPFQRALTPILLAVVVATLIRPAWGTLLFIFAFPLINNLPYFFGLAEPLPLAPTALVLCLFYLWAHLLRGAFGGPVRPEPYPIFRPMGLFAVLVSVSALITFFRYANYFPFISDGIYELTTNMYHVTSGGAIMSVVFTALNYLTGIGFFLCLITSLNSRPLIKRAIECLAISSALSLAFAIFQQFVNPKFGNNPISISNAFINGTFKDAMSFGAFLAMVAPLFLLATFWFRKGLRVFCLALFFLSSFMILFSGSKSGLLALSAALVLCGIMMASHSVKSQAELEREGDRRKKYPARAWIVSIIIISSVALVGYLKKEVVLKTVANSSAVQRVKLMASNLSLKKMFWWRADTLWPLAGDMIKDYPITGIGMGAYIIEVSNYAKDRNMEIGTPESAENSALQIGSELGLVGLLIAAWIFWEIIKQIARQLKSKSRLAADRRLLIGLMGGIFVFVLISFVHTFIWSYEIHYTFWLLVGLVFCLGQRGEDAEGPQEKAAPVRKKRVAGALTLVALLIFSGVHLWNSTHALSLESRASKYGFKQDFGFYQQEKTADGREFRWTGRHAGTEILVEKAKLEVSLLASHPDVTKRPVNVKVYFVKRLFREKHLLGEIRIKDANWKNYEFSLSPEDIGRNGILLFKVDRTWIPRKALRVPDPRRLGVAVGSIRFRDLKP